MSLITVFPNLLPPPAILTKKMPQIIFSVSISSLRQKKSESPYILAVLYTRTDRLGFHTEIQIILFTVLVNMY